LTIIIQEGFVMASYQFKRFIVVLVIVVAAAVVLFGVTAALGEFSGLESMIGSAAHTVCESGQPACDFSSIQAAVDAANGGDVIKVASGIYTGSISGRRHRTMATGLPSLKLFIFRRNLPFKGDMTLPLANHLIPEPILPSLTPVVTAGFCWSPGLSASPCQAWTSAVA
jgi:hypothetical protein